MNLSAHLSNRVILHSSRVLSAQSKLASSFKNNTELNMPKKSSGGSSKGQSSSASEIPVQKGPISQNKDGHFSIAIQVKPGAKVNGVTGVSEEAVSIQIAAPPVDGEANTAIVKYFAEILGLRKADVSLKGGKSRQKTVTIDSSTGLTAEKIFETLKSLKE